MIRDRAIRAREKLLGKLPITGELLQRTVWHRTGCPKCARGEGRRVFVLTVGGGKVPDAKTIGRWGMAVGPQVLKRLHARIVTIARERGVVVGRRMRVGTTVVETNVHYPTDSSLLGDGVTVLTRTMKKITKICRRGRNRVTRIGVEVCSSSCWRLRVLRAPKVARAKKS